jgi:hypothetical protein
MEINKRTYPHPVLAEFNDDYQQAIFQPSVQISGNKAFYKIQMNCKTSSKALNQLISEKKAAYAVHVECSSTRYRALFKSFEESFEIDIPVVDIDNKVQLSRLIIANCEINDFQNSELHPDFSDSKFNLVAGDVLAVAAHIDFYADKKEDELAKLPSIFSIVRNEYEDPKAIDVDITGQKIQIILSPGTYDKFKYLNTDPSLHSTLAATLIFPSLTYAIDQISVDKDHAQYIDLRWYRVLSRRLKDLSIEITNFEACGDSSITVANRLIGDVISDSLNDLNGLFSEDE